MKAPYVATPNEPTPALTADTNRRGNNTYQIAWTAINVLITLLLIGYTTWIFYLRAEQPTAAQTPNMDAVAGSGALGGVRYLSSQKISIEPEKFEQLANILCDGMASGSNGTSMTYAVKESIGATEFDAATIMATSVVYMCPEYIAKIGR